MAMYVCKLLLLLLLVVLAKCPPLNGRRLICWSSVDDDDAYDGTAKVKRCRFTWLLGNEKLAHEEKRLRDSSKSSFGFSW